MNKEPITLTGMQVIGIFCGAIALLLILIVFIHPSESAADVAKRNADYNQTMLVQHQQWLGSHIIYFRDPNTKACFAALDPDYTIHTSITYVPCYLTPFWPPANK